MKKAIAIIVLGLLWCNVGYSEDSVSANKVCRNIGFEPGTEKYIKCKFEFLKEFETQKEMKLNKLKSIEPVIKIDFGCYNRCKESVKGMSILSINSFCRSQCQLK